MKRELIEARFIAAIAKDTDGERLAECRGLPVEAFTDDSCARAWAALKAAPDFLTAQTHDAVRGFFANPTLGESFKQDCETMFFAWLRQLGIDRVDEWLSALPASGSGRLRALLTERAFNQAAPPPQPEPRFLIGGRPVCTPGNITNVIAQAKSGKSAFIGAMEAAAICAAFGISDRDTLSVTAAKPGGAILHFDTEQSIFDHYECVMRTLRRADVEHAPGWLRSFALAGMSAKDLRRALGLSLKESGPIFAVILDGTADFVRDVNDADECNAFVAELHSLAITHNCPIISVVHENPGQDGGKMRGHLGSQLERKAESNLRLRKTDETTVVFSEKMRRAPILEKDGPRFRWSDEHQMHVSCESVGASRDDIKRERLADQAEAVFHAAGAKALTWSALRDGIAKSEGIGPSGAGKRFDAMKSLGVVKKDTVGMWRLAA